MVKKLSWHFQTDRPIYLQLEDRIKLSIISGEFAPGEKLPAVRDMAVEAGVNPNTVQRSYAELERAGLVFSQRTSGRFVTEEKMVVEKMKAEMAAKQIELFFKSMAAIGFDVDETLKLISEKAGR